MKPLPLELQQAIEEGALTDEQLRELITLEAEALGLTFKEAVECARAGTLPHNLLGSDLQLLVQLLLSP